MKRILLSICLISLVLFTTSLFLPQNASAQNVGINSTGNAPNASAMLDVSETNRGLLIPRVSLTLTGLATPVTAPATSLLVYNTATVNDVTPGYYFWDGAKWVRFQDANAVDDWHISGNTGTDPSTNFLGTIDSKDLVFRTRNTEEMRITSIGNVGIGTSNPTYKLHIYGASNNAADVYSQTDAGRVVKHWFVNATRRWSIGQIGTTQAPNSSFQITDETLGTVRMSFTTAGYIGVATTSPSQSFDINGNLRLRLHIYDSNNSAGINGDILSRDAGGIIWVDPLTLDNEDWSLLGNAGTNPATNFIGTTDNQEFSIRTNNTEFFRITTKGQIEPKNTGYSIFIGEQAGENDDLTNNNNVALGWNALHSNTTGNLNNSIGSYSMYYAGAANNNNVAIGQFAMRGTTTYTNTSSNVAIGSSSLYHINGGDYNIALGVSPLYENTTGSNNIAFGNGASSNNTTGNYNIASGAGALSQNTTGSNNIAVGHYAANRTQGSDNIAIGEDALRYARTTCDYNVAIGYHAMRNISDYINSEYNVAVGANSLESIDDNADYNVAIGAHSLRSNTTGTDNTANGYQTLYANTTGRYCTAIGSNALYSNTTAYSNTATGYSALYYNSTGQYNTANGYHSLYYNTTGYNNTAVGRRSLYNNTTAYNNTAIGMQAMSQHQSGNYNFAAGYQAMYYSRTGNDYNIAIGDAMHGTTDYTDTDYNVGIGDQSLDVINGGDYNIGIGRYTLNDITTGSRNVALGNYAGNSLNATTTSCTFIGYDANGGGGTYTNSTALGYGSRIDGDNQIHLGNTTITEIEGQVSYATYSDGRIKENVSEDVKGLDFITKLRPVTYNINKDKQDEIMGITDSSKYVEKYDIEKIRFTGFIAQEVEQAATDCDYNFSGVNKAKHENDLYSLKYSEFVVPLVKATQEQQVIIEEQKNIIKQQQQQINEILKRLEEIEKQ